jgi:hypothetical protein
LTDIRLNIIQNLMKYGSIIISTGNLCSLTIQDLEITDYHQIHLFMEIFTDSDINHKVALPRVSSY